MFATRRFWIAILGLFLAREGSAQIVGPGVARPGEAEGANGWLATIPLATDGGTSLFVSVGINGAAPRWWALDSGASQCLIDRSVANGLGLVTRGSRQIHGAGKGTVRTDSVRSRVELTLAGRAIPTCEHFVTVDLSGTATGGYRRIAGILGYEFFSRYIVRVDFAGHTMRLYDPVNFRYAGPGDTVALDFARNLPHVAVRIRTARRPEVTRHLIVDTGSEDAVDDSAVRRTPGGPAITVQTTGLGNSYEVVIGTLDTVRIGRSVFTAVPGVASDVGIVGNGIWSRFVCVFDYSHRRLFLEPR
jgi:Aspartyl protease